MMSVLSMGQSVYFMLSILNVSQLVYNSKIAMIRKKEKKEKKKKNTCRWPMEYTEIFHK